MKIQRLDPKRAVFYLLLAGFLPLVTVYVWFSIETDSIDSANFRLQEAMRSAEELTERESDNRLIRKAYSQADHFYIDRSIETISPLKKEIEELQKVTSNKSGHPEAENYRRRLEALQAKNRILFTQISNKAYSNFKETHEALSAPIEVDIDDIKLLLSRIEGTALVDGEPPSDRPHLLITDCSLERRPGSSQQVYQLQMKLLKREYNQ